MGVGTPANILEGIERGVDMFDCVMPTRNGRNGMLFTRNGIMNMRNKKWADDFLLSTRRELLMSIHVTVKPICAIYSLVKKYWPCR